MTHTAQGIEQTIANLRAEFHASQRPGWDGYDAEPVSQSTFAQACAFLNALPRDIVMPSVGAEPDGDLTFEWYVSPRRVLSVSIGQGEELHYAALLGKVSRQSGTEPFLGEVPPEIVRLIHRVFGK